MSESRKNSMKWNRRDIFKLGAAAAVTAVASPVVARRSAFAQGKRPGANDQIAVGVVGCGGRAQLLMAQLPESARQIALADCNIEQAFAYREQRQTDWDIYAAHDRIMDRTDIDAVIITGQEFQRVLPCIHAVQSGKDVYAEKPLTLYIQEGRTLVEHVRKHKTVFQVGSQQRSMEMNRVACEFVRNGGLGKIKYVQAVNYTGADVTPDVDSYPHSPIPGGFNWELHLGQSPWRPFGPGALAGRNYGGGEMTNWGAHGVDQIQWGLGTDDTLPVEFTLVTPGKDGKVTARYANGIEVRFELPMSGPMGGCIFVGEKGKLEVNRNKFMSNPIDIRNELLKKVDEAEEEVKWSDQTALWQARWHLQNWLDCIRTRERPRADVEIGHRSIALCHLANITRYVGRVGITLKFDPKTERFIDNDEANYWNDRPRRRGYELPPV
ncbi:MAG: Gfo/Idh/MocA family oxidoreductase [Thermoguttaceae bacterium]|nr:Gfo/Idh/MocA family oxidoreductase [Thermoguttaceae bacterium]